MEYVIKGDSKEFKDCLILVCGKSEINAKLALQIMLDNPTDNYKKLIQNMSNLRIKEVEDKDCWWNDNCD